MNSIIIAIAGYFLISLEAVASKFLLSGKIRSWNLYIFYVGLLSLFSFIFAPFGLTWYGWEIFIFSLISGIFFFSYLAFLYKALEISPASAVYIFTGAVSVIGTFFLARLFLEENIQGNDFLGLGLLLFGGLLISIHSKKGKPFRGFYHSLVAGILLAISLVLLKDAFNNQNFVSGYIYTRLGIALPVFLALMVPGFRKGLIKDLAKRDHRQNTRNFFWVLVAKSLSGLGTLLVNVGIYWGSVTVVNALMSVQYLFTFLLAVILSIYYKKIFAEELDQRSLLIKSLGVVLVIGGVVLVS